MRILESGFEMKINIEMSLIICDFKFCNWTIIQRSPLTFRHSGRKGGGGGDPKGALATTQCSGRRGVDSTVHTGYATWGHQCWDKEIPNFFPQIRPI